MSKIKLSPKAVRLQTFKEIGAEDFFDSYLQFQYRSFASYVKKQIKLNPNGFIMNRLNGTQCLVKYETVGIDLDSYKEFRVYSDLRNTDICSVYDNVFELYMFEYYKNVSVEQIQADPEYSEAIIKNINTFNRRLREYRCKMGIVEMYLKLHTAMNNIKDRIDAFVDKHKEKFPELAQAVADDNIKTQEDIDRLLKK